MKPGFFNEKLATVLAVLMFALVVLAVIANIKDAYMWLCFMPVMAIIAFGFGASILLRPVFIYRYMIPGMAAFWFGVLLGARELFNKKKVLLAAGALLMILMTVFCIRDFWAFRGNELYKRVNMVESGRFWDCVNAGMDAFHQQEDAENVASSENNTVIICNFDQVAALSLYYANGQCDIVGDAGENLPVPVYFYGAMTDEVLKNLVPGIRVIDTPSQVRELVDSGANVLFVGSFNSREDIVKEWQDTEGISSENKGSFLLERYWFDVFELR